MVTPSKKPQEPIRVSEKEFFSQNYVKTSRIFLFSLLFDQNGSHLPDEKADIFFEKQMCERRRGHSLMMAIFSDLMAHDGGHILWLNRSEIFFLSLKNRARL